MSSKRFASVWDAIENNSVEAENMKLRSRLMIAVRDYIEREGLSQTQAAKLFGVTQPRISDLVRGKIDLFSIDMLVNMASAAGLHIDMKIAGRRRDAGARAPPPGFIGSAEQRRVTEWPSRMTSAIGCKRLRA